MAVTNKLAWDQVGDKRYETGTDHGAVYPYGTNGYGNGVAWNGLTGVSESPDGAEETPLYADNIKYASLMSAENFKATIKAYTYPDEVAVLDGSAPLKDASGAAIQGVNVGQQPRGTFGFSWRTMIGNDVQGTDFGYKLNLVYGAKLSPSARDNATVNDSPAALEFSWDVTTTPVDVPGMKPTAHIVLDSTKLSDSQMKAVEAILYGSDTTPARLPLPAELVSILAPAAPASEAPKA